MAAWLAGGPAPAAPGDPIPGFGLAAARERARWEQVVLATPQPDSARRHLRILSEEPHVAGTPADHATALYVRDRARAYGLEAELQEFHVLLNYPRRVSLVLEAPVSEPLSLREVPISGDKDSADPAFFDGFHGYSADGEVAAQVLYANYGRAEDYKAIEKLGVSVRGKIVLVRYGKLFRGLKVRLAEERGAAGVLIYSDPADDGYAQGDIYPDGPWRHPSAIQRGSVQYLSIAPGDPTTPGWGSAKGARRIRRSESDALARIPSLPLSYGEASKLLERLAGPGVPAGFQGGLPFAYHVGPGPARVRMAVENDYAIRPIWNVVVRIPGSERPDRWVMAGNHRDAWTYGAVDPNGGSAAGLEMLRALGEALEAGWRPRRTIVFCSWDAEEYGLVGSVEFGEADREALPGRVVAYFNMDSAVRGQELQMSGVPSLRDHLAAAARDVGDPVTGRPLLAAWEKKQLDAGKAAWLARTRLARAAGAPAPPREAEIGPLGSGSDYTVFLDHLGIPAVDLRFSGADGIYHSAYDNLNWVERFGDPLLLYHGAAARLLGLAVMRMADAEVVPLRYARYARAIDDYLVELAEKVEDRELAGLEPGGKPLHLEVAPARALAARLRRAAETLEAEIERSLASGAPTLFGRERARVDDELVAVEQDFLAADGIVGRPWFRHLVFAPGKDTGYAPIPLPEPAHAVLDEDQAALDAGMRRLEAVLARATGRLERLVASGP
jgi:N-acetylated-alpha-linked acidic dipeptidase